MTPWHGGPVEGPLLEDERVTLYFRGGDILQNCRAGDYSWVHTRESGDIVGYEISSEEGIDLTARATADSRPKGA